MFILECLKSAGFFWIWGCIFYFCYVGFMFLGYIKNEENENLFVV